MLSTRARLCTWAALALIALATFAFSKKQNTSARNRPRIGGRVSRPKQLWLGWAVFVWFIQCPILALEPKLAFDVRLILGSFAIFMWARGLVELYMLYVSKNWRPPMGIAHNLACATLIVALALRGELLNLVTPLDRWGLAWVLVVFLSLLLETGYAVAFHRAVRGKTTGDDAIWFADAEDPKFRRINRVTAAVNVPLYGFLLVFLWQGLIR